MVNRHFLIVALSPVGGGLSGGDRIFIELAKLLVKQGYRVSILTWADGQAMARRNGLTEKDVEFVLINMHFWPQLGFILNYFARIIYGIMWAINFKIDISQRPVIYSASEFWMDIFPSWVLKMRYGNKITLVNTWFQTAPNPLTGFAEGERENRYRMKALLYWLTQLPAKFIIKRTADYVLVNNDDEKKQFPGLTKKGKSIVMLGGVKVNEINTWRKKHNKMMKKYDAVFQGRFHPQKGVVELVEIWKKVVDKKPQAKLAMIGDGPLMEDVREKIKDLGLEGNITLFGYVFDGDKKYTIFSESRIVVHPALYDSGGMASAEAMAFGLPCVGFDLTSYKSYYPYGMIKAPIGNLNAFADKIILLLTDAPLRKKVSREGVTMITNNLSWKKRVHEVLDTITADENEKSDEKK
jgi:glycosyltransferase involved in cell wall biosynthesis